jgi:hypothetical protein
MKPKGTREKDNFSSEAVLVLKFFDILEIFLET